MLLDAATEELAAALPPDMVAACTDLVEVGLNQAVPSCTAGSASAAGADGCGGKRGDESNTSLLEQPTPSQLAWGAANALLWAEALPLLREARAAIQPAAAGQIAARAGEHAGGKAATAARARARTVNALAGRWLHSLGCGSGPTLGEQSRTKREGRATGGLQGALGPEDTDGGARAHRGLVCLCLLTAGLPPSDRAAFFARHGPRLFPPVAAACAACTGAALPLALLRALLPSLLRTSQDASTLLQPLLDALQTTSRASAAASALAAELAISHPSIVLPDVIRLLSSRLASQRTNGLAILHAASARIGLRQLTDRSRLAEALLQAVLPMLGDAEMNSRLQAAGLFAHLEPPRALSFLSPFLLSRDARVRSAAEAALLAALSGGAGATRALGGGGAALTAGASGQRAATAAAAILDVLRDWPAVGCGAAGGSYSALLSAQRGAMPSHPTVLHPGQVGPPSPVEGPAQATEGARRWNEGLGGVAGGGLGLEVLREGEEADSDSGEDVGAGAGTGGAPSGDAASGSCAPTARLAARFESRVLRLLDQWCATLGPDGWRSALRVVCVKFFAAAKERASLRVLRRMVAHPASAGHRHMLIPAALARMGHAGEVTVGGGGMGGTGALSVSDARDSYAPASAPPDSCSTRGGGGTGDDTGDAAALARVRPLLMLSLLPEDAWSRDPSGIVGHSAGAATFSRNEPNAGGLPDGTCPAAPPDVWLDPVPELRFLLLQRARDTTELRQTRKLATSLLARLPPGQLLHQAMEAVKLRVDEALAACAAPPAAQTGTVDSSVSLAQGVTGERGATAGGALDGKSAVGGAWDNTGDAQGARGGEADALDATLSLFYLCCAVSLHKSAATLVSESPLVGSLIGTACADLRSPADVQLQAGCKDCLARLIATWPLFASRGVSLPCKAAAEAGDGGDELRGAALVLTAVLARREQPGAQDVLAMASQLTHATHGAAASEVLARRAIPLLLDCSDAGAVSTIFTLAFNARSQLDEKLLNALLARALADTALADAHARLGALKLLGLVLADGGESEVWGDKPEQMLERVLHTLSSLATIDASREVRALAQSLETAAFGGRVGAQG
jgi:hypothetical protein